MLGNNRQGDHFPNRRQEVIGRSFLGGMSKSHNPNYVNYGLTQSVARAAYGAHGIAAAVLRKRLA